MTIDKAIEGLLITEKFKADARKDAKLRVFQQRYREGALRKAAVITLLERYGYRIEAFRSTGK